MAIYETIAATAVMPSATEVAEVVNSTLPQVEAAFEELHEKRLLVPEPDNPSRIRMAPPFSGIETDFPVEAAGKVYYANCAWDAFGILAALAEDGRVQTHDGHDGQTIQLEIKDGAPLPADRLAHFAVPAAGWWEDIIYT